VQFTTGTKMNTSEKGDVALIKVIADLYNKGYTVFLPMSQHLTVDLIAYKDNKSYRIQVKHCNNSHHCIANRKSWTNSVKNVRIKYDKDAFDFYAIYYSDINVVIYPSIKYGGVKIRTELPETNWKYYWYEDFLEFTTDAIKRQRTNAPYRPKLKTRTHIWPTKEELEKLLWEKPSREIAKEYKIADTMVNKWCKHYGLTKPGRGYWQKKRAGLI
jgi:hypothetical protein